MHPVVLALNEKRDFIQIQGKPELGPFQKRQTLMANVNVSTEINF